MPMHARPDRAEQARLHVVSPEGVHCRAPSLRVAAMVADTARIPLWPLPLLIALLFLVAAHAAYLLSIHAGHVPACVPYLEGCVSISRAARHGVGNHLFRLLVIPCAVLHALVWVLAHRWLRGGRRMVVLGVGSAIALAVYATFLGTDGETYRFLRRYGVVVYFGFGYLAQLRIRLSRAAGVDASRVADGCVADPCHHVDVMDRRRDAGPGYRECRGGAGRCGRVSEGSLGERLRVVARPADGRLVCRAGGGVEATACCCHASGSRLSQEHRRHRSFKWCSWRCQLKGFDQSQLYGCLQRIPSGIRGQTWRHPVAAPRTHSWLGMFRMGTASRDQ